MTLATFTDKFVSFLIGLVLGVLATLATFGGRVSALEATVNIETREISDVHTEVAKLADNFLAFIRK